MTYERYLLDSKYLATIAKALRNARRTAAMFARSRRVIVKVTILEKSADYHLNGFLTVRSTYQL